MKCIQWLFCVWVLGAATSPMAAQSAISPAMDPLAANRVPGPLTVSGLALRQRIGPPALFYWELLRQLQFLTTPQVRTLALDLLRVRRCSYAISPADLIVVDAWADRDLAAAATEILHIPDWEDGNPAIGDDDSDVEFVGAALWTRLAEKDFAKAMELADRLTGQETIRQFFEHVDHPIVFEDAFHLRQWLDFWTRHLPASEVQEMAVAAVALIAGASGADAAGTACQQLPEGKVKEAVEAKVMECARNRLKGKRVRRTISNGQLRRLDQLEPRVDRIMAFPWEMIRRVGCLTPADALRLGQLLSGEKSVGPWLGWVLAMRASEGDPWTAAALRLPFTESVSVPALNTNWPQFDVTYAMATREAGTIDKLEMLPEGEERNAAFRGYFSRADLSLSDRGITLATRWKLGWEDCMPLLSRLVVEGQAVKALQMAEGLMGRQAASGDADGPVYQVLEALALHNFAEAVEVLWKLPVGRADSRMSYVLSFAIAVHPPSKILPLLTSDFLERYDEPFPQPYFTWLGIEDPDAARAWIGPGTPAGWKQVAAERMDEVLKGRN